ncbi:unnamed protein product [Prorocentrum cordatum]|uniref:J domain-containing protein n=1 Tax=Prorocentrum cordatum TaxID=2364126 RepID=A0ABN9VU21_9DINO|nr:unnamed protein product [Polarella glacialis]
MLRRRPDLYEVLELPRGSGPEEIKAAYRRLVRECHPDVRPGDAAAAARFRQVSHAHTTLLHVGLRRMYDLHLRRMEGIENCRRLEEQRRGQGIAARLRGRGRGALGALALGAGLGALLVAALAAAMLSLPGFFWTAFHRIPDWVPGKWGLVRLHSQEPSEADPRPRGMEGAFPDDDPEYPGVRWVLVRYVLTWLKDGVPMPRCQDLPAKAFGSLRGAPRVFAVTHPWLDRWHPDPAGIQVETMRAKFDKMRQQMMTDLDDVLFFDYLCLPQVSTTGVDDRSPAEKLRFRSALSGDQMGRISVPDESRDFHRRGAGRRQLPRAVPRPRVVLLLGGAPDLTLPPLGAPPNFESAVASMNTFPRDLMWTQRSLKEEIARFRTMSAEFRQTGDITAIVDAFDSEIASKSFAQPSDRDLVRGLFVSLARSQRLIAASARGDVKGVQAAIDDGADLKSRNGHGHTALHVAAANGHTGVVSVLLKRSTAFEVSMTTMENESSVDLAKNWRESSVLLRHNLGEPFPPLIVLTIHGDLPPLKELLSTLQADDGGAQAFPSAGIVTSELALVNGEKNGPAARAGAVARESSASENAPQASHDKKIPARGPKTLASPAGAPPAAKPRAPPGKTVPAKAKSSPVRGAALRTAAAAIAQPSMQSAPLPVEGEAVAGGSLATRGGAAEAKPVPKASGAHPRDARRHAVKPVLAIDVNEADDIGWTALHYAVSMEHAAIAKELLQSRADPTRCNAEGESPAALAARLDVKAVLSELREGEGLCEGHFTTKDK